ncbi:MAG: dipeptide ABC transporter ATP-binding protein [Nitratireductor sp.]
MALLEISGLTVTIGASSVLTDVGLTLERGQIMGLVGESGSGKSMTALSTMRLLPEAARLSGSIRFDGEELVEASEKRMCELRGDDIGMVFQEPMTALNPLKTIGEQVAEGIRLHAGLSPRQALERAAETLADVGLPQSQFALSRYPHELSGGQRQRVGIAIACSMNPKLLIADEPTTALDVTIQAKILDLLKSLVQSRNMALLFISHDLAVVAGMADTIAVMRQGKILDTGPAHDLLRQRRHTYTARLAEASAHVPKKLTPPVFSDAPGAPDPLLAVRSLVCQYPGHRKGLFHKPEPFIAVNSISFDVLPSQIMGLVGESGCGKSTLARTLLGLHKPSSGSIDFDHIDIVNGGMQALREARREMQIVFQDPYGSFNPRHRVARLVAEPLHLRPELSKTDKRDRAAAALEAVGLKASDLGKYAHEFSGGQRQRIAIARALVNQPKLIIADEPVSALDVSIRAQVLDLLSELRDRLGLAYLFISHDLSVVRALCDEVMVMRNGEIIERGKADDIFNAPVRKYTRRLVNAAPDLQRVLAEE